MGSRPPETAEIRKENHTFFLQNQEIQLAKKATIQLLWAPEMGKKNVSVSVIAYSQLLQGDSSM